jgi:LacI family transcriptional regulator
VDSEHGAYTVVRHLLGQGYRRIGMITGPSEGPGSVTYGRAQRYAGYCRALQDAGLEVDPRLVVEGNFRHAGGRDAMERLLASGVRPDAVFASNDLMAIGAMDAARAAGLRVPADIALAGNDDIPIAGLLTPGLTTMAMPKQDLGATAANLLREQIPYAGAHRAERHTFSAQLVVRSSSLAVGLPT